MKEVEVGDHAALSERFNADESRVNWHDETLWWVRQKRDKAAGQIEDWELLRETASQIKNNVLSNLHDYLVQFEKNAQANGIKVHWAVDAQEHNEIVHAILKEHGINQIGASGITGLTYVQHHNYSRPSSERSAEY